MGDLSRVAASIQSQAFEEFLIVPEQTRVAISPY